MTANRLHHLAELASEAARYYRSSHQSWARAMATAAVIARIAAAHEHRGEDAHRLGWASVCVRAGEGPVSGSVLR